MKHLILHGLDEERSSRWRVAMSLRKQLERTSCWPVWEQAALEMFSNPAIVGTTATVTLANDTHGIKLEADCSYLRNVKLIW